MWGMEGVTLVSSGSGTSGPPEVNMDLERLMRECADRYEAVATVDWQLSRQGNEYANIGDYNVAIFESRDGWGYRVQHQHTGETHCSEESLATGLDSKVEALEVLENLNPAEFDRLLKLTPADELTNTPPVRREGNVLWVAPQAWGRR